MQYEDDERNELKIGSRASGWRKCGRLGCLQQTSTYVKGSAQGSTRFRP